MFRFFFYFIFLLNGKDVYADVNSTPVYLNLVCQQTKHLYTVEHNIHAQYLWGDLLIKGTCGHADLEQGIALIKDAADKEDRDALYKYAQILYDFFPEQAENVEVYISHAANLGQFNALAFYGSQALLSNNLVSSCIFYDLAIKHNPSSGRNMSEEWKSIYSSSYDIYHQLSSSNQQICTNLSDKWIINTDVRQYIKSHITF